MIKINLNKFAREVTLEEGNKKNLTIGDVKEVQKLTFERLVNCYSAAQIMEMLERYLK